MALDCLWDGGSWNSKVARRMRRLHITVQLLEQAPRRNANGGGHKASKTTMAYYAATVHAGRGDSIRLDSTHGTVT